MEKMKNKVKAYPGDRHRAKKSLGQNFLKSKSALDAMCKSSDLFKSDVVLEIGPGKGALTEYLLRSVDKVIAIEKDHNLCEILSEKFKNEITNGHLVLVKGDVLEFDPNIFNLRKGEYKIIANIPYNITGAIIKKFLTMEDHPESMTLLVQKEVAERIVARDSKESILSISVKAYGTPKYVTKVGKKFFSPAPKVDSAIITIKNISKNNFLNLKEEERFFEIVKAGFAHKRKVVIKNLEDVLPKIKLQNYFEKTTQNPKSRAEDFGLEEWLDITRKLNR